MSTYMLYGLPGENRRDDEQGTWVAYYRDPRDNKRHYVTVNADRFFNGERSARMAVTRTCNTMASNGWVRQQALTDYGRILERKDFIIERVRINLEVIPE